MRIAETVSQVKKAGCVLSIGNFDGVHIGHQAVLAVGKRIAAARKTELVVLTFEPHPVVILQPHKGLGVLTPLAVKKHLLDQCGVDCLIVLPCDAGILSLSALDFVSRFIAGGVEPGVVVEGENFHFGSGRSGNVELLRRFGVEAGFEVVVVEPKAAGLAKGQVRSSSSLVRHLLEAGDVADAAIALGRSYRLYGQVIAGRGRGKRLGFATANIDPAEQIIPSEGVYAGFVAIAGNRRQVCMAEARQPAALSIGRSSTYGGENPLLLEAHLLKEDVDLYGKYLAMDFVGRIRSQHKFRTEKELAKQIAKDCEKAGKILTAEHAENAED